MIPARKHLAYARGFIELGLADDARAELAHLSTPELSHPGTLPVRLELAMLDECWDEIPLLSHALTLLDPAAERPWIAWAYALREQHHITEARDVLLRALAVIAAPSPLVAYNLACYHCLLGNLPEALRLLKDVFARDPSWKAEATRDPDLAALRFNT